MKFNVHLRFMEKSFNVNGVTASSASEALSKAKEYLVQSKAFRDYCMDNLRTDSVTPDSEPTREVKDILDFFK